MSGTRADVGIVEFLQKRADVSLAIDNAEALLDDPLEIDPPPANEAILLAVMPRLGDSSKLRQPFSAQPWRHAACMDVAQTIRTLIVKTMNPVAKRLALHSAYAGGVRPVHAIQHRSQRQQPTALIGVLRLLGEATQISGRLNRA